VSLPHEILAFAGMNRGEILRPPTPSANPSLMTDSTSTDSARLDELEMRVVHQDQTIDELNEAITAQWKLIDRLERQVARLGERVAETEQAVSEAAPANTPPPHY